MAQSPNTPPIVMIQNMMSVQEYQEPATVSLRAEAYDMNGSIKKVEFYLCNTKLAELDTEPYEIILSQFSAGTYCITAKATDNSDSTAESHPYTIQVHETPDSCKNTAEYLEHEDYTAGDLVKNGNHQYACKPWPYSGWCSGAAWAYAPGTGAHWQDAWIDLGICIPDSNPPCGDTPQYLEYGEYGPESQVVNQGIKYECKPWPYSGWCSGAAWAYAPGTGSYWQDAWIELGTCSDHEDEMNASTAAKIIMTPHPFEHYTSIKLDTDENIVALHLYSSSGSHVLSLENLNKKEMSIGEALSSGYYILHITTQTGKYTQTLLKW